MKYLSKISIGTAILFAGITLMALVGCNKSQNKLITDKSFVIEDTTITLYPDNFTYQPEQGYVPNKETAARIAEAVWLPVYGEKTIYEERPYHVHLIGDSVWIVWGNFDISDDLNDITYGGSAFMAISKKDGRILQMLHEK